MGVEEVVAAKAGADCTVSIDQIDNTLCQMKDEFAVGALFEGWKEVEEGMNYLEEEEEAVETGEEVDELGEVFDSVVEVDYTLDADNLYNSAAAETEIESKNSIPENTNFLVLVLVAVVEAQ